MGKKIRREDRRESSNAKTEKGGLRLEVSPER
jgi:hypothetical protein